MVTKLKYGNTNTYFIRGAKGSIVLDTDYARTYNVKPNGVGRFRQLPFLNVLFIFSY